MRLQCRSCSVTGLTAVLEPGGARRTRFFASSFPGGARRTRFFASSFPGGAREQVSLQFVTRRSPGTSFFAVRSQAEPGNEFLFASCGLRRSPSACAENLTPEVNGKPLGGCRWLRLRSWLRLHIELRWRHRQIWLGLLDWLSIANGLIR